MPSLMLRGLAPDLVARVRAYARARDLSLPESAARLLAAGLDHLEARAAGGRARAESLSDEQRAGMARQAAEARWNKSQ